LFLSPLKKRCSRRKGALHEDTRESLNGSENMDAPRARYHNSKIEAEAKG
jgi:hypothetical protein